MSLIDLDDRLRPFQSIFNFRDFGGYKGASGRAVVTGKLFRSAHLNALSEADMAEIDALPIGVITDFRHAPERVKQPSKWSGRAVVLTQPEADETLDMAPHEAFARERLYTADDARDYMLGSYAKRMHDPSFVALHREALLEMAHHDREDDGVLVHCAAGKDRTGTFVALVQSLLGVNRDDILADYMLTETAVNIEAILEPAAGLYTQRYGRPISADALRPMFGVDPDYIAISLEKMGEANAYASEVLGLGPGQIKALRDRYLDVD